MILFDNVTVSKVHSVPSETS